MSSKAFFFAFNLVLILICFFYKFLVVLFRLHSTFFVLSGVHNWYRQCFKQYLVKPKKEKKKSGFGSRLTEVRQLIFEKLDIQAHKTLPNEKNEFLRKPLSLKAAMVEKVYHATRTSNIGSSDNFATDPNSFGPLLRNLVSNENLVS